jgi:tRNA A-37 threonylcarbamoyl transferase component Bud32
MSTLAAPPGTVAERRGRATLVADARRIDALREAGLADVECWRALLAGPRASRGRGPAVVVPLAGGTVRLKRLGRGGLLRGLWRDRVVGTRRLLDNLRLPAEAARRGIPTPRAVALMLLAGPPGFYRGWLALEDVPSAADLAQLFSSSEPPRPDELENVLRLVRRMHDQGLEHRDLNLGNLLVRRDGGSPAALVIDLDGARLHPGGLSLRLRLAALRRLERSFVKLAGSGGDEQLRRSFYQLYAAGDCDLAARLERGRRAGRIWIRLHALAWRR